MKLECFFAAAGHESGDGGARFRRVRRVGSGGEVSRQPADGAQFAAGDGRLGGADGVVGAGTGTLDRLSEIVIGGLKVPGLKGGQALRDQLRPWRRLGKRVLCKSKGKEHRPKSSAKAE